MNKNKSKFNFNNILLQLENNNESETITYLIKDEILELNKELNIELLKDGNCLLEEVSEYIMNENNELRLHLSKVEPFFQISDELVYFKANDILKFIEANKHQDGVWIYVNNSVHNMNNVKKKLSDLLVNSNFYSLKVEKNNIFLDDTSKEVKEMFKISEDLAIKNE